MISFVSISACQIKDYVGLGICQWDIDAVRIAALKLAIVSGEAWQRGGADNLVKYICFCVLQADSNVFQRLEGMIGLAGQMRSAFREGRVALRGKCFLFYNVSRKVCLTIQSDTFMIYAFKM